MRRAILALLLTAIVAVACGGEPDRPALMPVPGTVAFTIGVDLWLREDGEERLLVEPGEGRQVLSPALSPDGERIAFVRFQLTGGVDLSVGADLMIVDANGEVSTVIEHDQQAEYFWYPRWSSDGRSIVYTHEAPDIEISIERVELATGAVTVLRTLARDGDISPDGSRLVFSTTHTAALRGSLCATSRRAMSTRWIPTASGRSSSCAFPDGRPTGSRSCLPARSS